MIYPFMQKIFRVRHCGGICQRVEKKQEVFNKRMDFTGVYHKASEQMCYPLNEDELIVNLKTGYDVKRVFIYYGDPFEAGILGGKEQWAGKKKKRFVSRSI